MERFKPRPEEYTAYNLLKNPPGLILVFDNFRGNGAEKQALAQKTMTSRALVAARIWYSNLYEENTRPTICCLANTHNENGQPGSGYVKEILLGLGIPNQNIITRSQTITTKTDISALHSLMKEKELKSPAAIVTSPDHVQRTEQELVNHFNAHARDEGHPSIYVVSAATPQMESLDHFYGNRITISKLHQMIGLTEQELQGDFSGGVTEYVAYQLSSKKYLRPLQQTAEYLTHLGSSSLKKDRHREIAAKKIKKASLLWKSIKARHKNLIETEGINGLRQFSQKYPMLFKYHDVPQY